jgi:hypothetical protein
MPAVREGLSEGDFRDWKEIEEWTSGIGQELRSLVPSMGSAP